MAAVASVAVLAMLAGVGCDSSGDAEKGTGQSATIKVVTWSWVFLPLAVQQFEKAHPGVKVDVQASVTGQQYFDNVARTLPVSGADISVLQAIPGPFKSMQDAGQLENLNSVWTDQGLADAYSPAVAKSYTAADGNHYAINVDTFFSPIIWYNKDAFAKAGIKPPAQRISSQEEFLSMGKALKAAGYVPIAMESDGNGPAWAFSVALQSSCGDAGFANLTANWDPKVAITTPWTDACVIKALDTVSLYAKNGLYGSAFATQKVAQARTLFTAGKAGMLVSGSYFDTLFPDPKSDFHIKFPYGWTLYPPVPGGAPTKIQVFSLDALGVNARSKNKELAKQFLAFLASKEFNSQPAVQAALPGIQPRSDVNFAPDTAPARVEISQAAAGNIGAVPNLTVSVPWQSSVNSEVLNMLAGQTDANAVAQKFAGLNDKARANPTR
jgi:raffinose/stachyose/melibiose transport system substrate-binding protein